MNPFSHPMDYLNWSIVICNITLVSMVQNISTFIHYAPLSYYKIMVIFPCCIIYPCVFIFFFFNLSFYWRIIALQNFAIFSHTPIWISHRYTYISQFYCEIKLLLWDKISPFRNSLSLPSPSHPSRLIQSPCLSFLSYTENSCCLSILHMVM